MSLHRTQEVSITGTETQSMDVTGCSIACIQVPTADWDGSVMFEVSYDGTNYVAANCINSMTMDGQVNCMANFTGSPQVFKADVAGAQLFRIRANSSTGTFATTMTAYDGGDIVPAILATTFITEI